MNKPQLLHQIDACRNSADLALPELAELRDELPGNAATRDLFERVQRLDQAIVVAVDDVPVPEGLAARILANLAQAESERGEVMNGPAIASEPVAIGAAAAPIVELRPMMVSSGRRRWLIAAGALASAAAACLVLYFGGFLGGTLPVQTADSLQQGAIDFFRQDPPATGETVDWKRPKADFPYSSYLVAIAHTQRRVVRGFLGQSRKSVAYDFQVRGAEATLYVSKFEEPLDLPSLPLRSPYNTQGCFASAWSENGYVYVLVVQGDARTYRDLLKPQRSVA